MTLSAGGRGIDQDGNGAIDSTEGVNAAPPKTLVGGRDGLRQTVIDLMQLVRAVEVGMDVDGNGSRDLDPARISYFGQSFGGIYGTKFLAVEPSVRTGVPNVPGGSIIEIARLSQSFRPLVWLSLVGRTPPLVNLPGLFQFNENIPLRNLPPLVDTVPGAEAIQRLIEWTEWTTQSGNPVAYAPHLILEPLAGVPAKSVLLQFARGDKTVPNPTTSAIIRAGGLESRTTLFRNDLARAAIPALPSNPHTFLTGIGGAGTRSRSRRRPRSRRSSLPAAPSRSTPTAQGRSSRRRWSGRPRRTWPTCRSEPEGAGVPTTPAPSRLIGSRHASGAEAARKARPWC